MKEIKSVEIKGDRVKMVVQQRDRWGIVPGSQRQMTFPRRQFESALRTAQMTVPWEKVEA